MNPSKPGLTFALIGYALLLLSACGGGGGGGSGGSSGGGSSNTPPTANAGPAQTVTAGATVTLNGSSSSDSDGSISVFSWTQTVGTAVSLSNATIAQPTFLAPTVTAATTLTFSLVVTDNRGASSAASVVNITVNPLANVPPTANAGLDQTVTSGNSVTLNGAASSDPDGVIASYAWTQTAGTAVTLSSATAAQPTFTAPTVASATALTFSLVVTDNAGASSSADTVVITVNPPAAGNVNVSGRVQYARPHFSPVFPNGLMYGSALMHPARGVVVRAINNTTQATLASSSTDANGNYTLTVPGNTTITVSVVAQLLRDAGQPLPRWNVRVQDGTGGTPYSFATSPFNSSAGGAQNVDIPLGINANGQATGTRASGPFAALDTIHEAIQFVLGASPQANFPSLIVDWGSQANGTFFDSGNPQRIALLSDLNADTDEFDTHVVAHEFGHYIEHNFSRSDSIGGSHGVGDKLDIRVAFGEGFGYAFAAMALNDPIARDSYRDTNFTPPLVSGQFNIDDNPPAPNDPTGCWCSESSIWSILWDVFDSGVEAGDNVALGFTPIWNVLTGTQRTTPAFTSLFSFMTALKAANPASEAAIDALLTAQNTIASGMNAIGSTETNQPSGVPAAATFPLYTTLTIPGSATLASSNDAGTVNKLGNRRYLRFSVASTRSVTVTLNSSNPNADKDPDFLVWRTGTFIRAGVDGPSEIPETETFTATPGDYLIEIYDCANGCGTPQGTAGDYDLTVTIN